MFVLRVFTRAYNSAILARFIHTSVLCFRAKKRRFTSSVDTSAERWLNSGANADYWSARWISNSIGRRHAKVAVPWQKSPGNTISNVTCRDRRFLWELIRIINALIAILETFSFTFITNQYYYMLLILFY